MKRSRIVLIALLAVLIIGALFLLTRGGGEESEPESEASAQVVVVATQSIPAFTEITEEMVTTKAVSGDMAHVNAFTDVSQVVGSTTVSDIAEQETILSNHVVSGDKGTTTAATHGIPEGMRAMTMMIDSQAGVAGLLQVGNHVDVILVTSDISTEGAGRNIATMLAENVEVIALDKSLGRPTPAPVSTGEEGEEEAQQQQQEQTADVEYSTVTLIVSPEDSLKIAWGLQEGYISLTMRGEGDETVVEPEDIRVVDII